MGSLFQHPFPFSYKSSSGQRWGGAGGETPERAFLNHVALFQTSMRCAGGRGGTLERIPHNYGSFFQLSIDGVGLAHIC